MTRDRLRCRVPPRSGRRMYPRRGSRKEARMFFQGYAELEAVGMAGMFVVGRRRWCRDAVHAVGADHVRLAILE